jgi:TonB family protein
MEELNNDIEKYLRGELTPAEMHALEQKALRDPFLADALEGAEHAGADNFSVDLLLLQKSIKEKAKKKKRTKIISLNIPNLYMSVAAGLLILVACTYVIVISIDQRRQSEMLALNNQQMEMLSQKSADSLTVVMPKGLQKETRVRSPRVNRVTTPYTGPAAGGIATTSRPTEATGDAAMQPVVSGSSAPSEIEVEAELSEAPVIVKNEDDAELKKEVAKTTAIYKDDVNDSRPTESRKRKRDSVSRSAPASGIAEDKLVSEIIRGSVVDDMGTPMPGVNVMLKGTNVGTVTGVDGNFQITIPPGSDVLVFNFIGYVSSEEKISDTDIKVAMKPDVQALSEVVVVGYGVSGGNADPEPETFEMAEPTGGRKEFNKYLEEQQQYPQQALDNKIEGRVTVEFTVLQSGNLDGFKIIKSLGYGCDEEVIRLIKEGPKWKPSKKNSQPIEDKVKVRLKFTLPQKK